MRRGHKAPLLQSPTGSGKTHVAKEIVDRAVARGSRVLFLAPRRELIYQCCEKLQSAGIRFGIIMAGENRNAEHLVQVASIPTLIKRRAKEGLPPADLVIVDEAHIGVGGEAQKLIESFPCRRIGLTATPSRADGRGLGVLYDDLVLGPTVSELTRLGFLVPVRYYAPSKPDLSGVKVTAGDYNQQQLGDVMNKPTLVGDVVTNWARIAPTRRTLVFSVTVAHSMALRDEFLGIGVKAEHLDGETPHDERAAIIKRFRAGTTQVLVNCFDSETEILTKRGFMRFDALRDDDVFAAVNSEGHVSWEKANHRVERQVAAGERMVELGGQRASIRVTEGHRMYWAASHMKKWQISEAKDLVGRNGTWLRLNAREDVPGLNLTTAEAEFLGLFYSDGHMTKYSTIEINQSERYEQTSCAEIERILTACGFDWRMRYAPPAKFKEGCPYSTFRQRRYLVPKGNIGGQLARRGVVKLLKYMNANKSFPPALFGMNAEQTFAFVYGMWLGDGVKHAWRPPQNDATYAITNTNEQLLSSLQALCVTRGLAARLRGPHKNGPMSTRPLYVLQINRRDSFVAQPNPKKSQKFSFTTPKPDERVWCISNDSGTVIVRRKGFVHVCGQCEVMTYGVDIPEITCGVLAKPTKSIARFLQMAGRLLRPCEGKQDCILIDHAGAVDEIGFVDDTFEWSLDGNKKVQKAADAKAPEKKPVTCSQCKHVYKPAPACPMCGHVPERMAAPIETVEHDLVELTRGQARLNRQWSEHDKRRFFGELKFISNEHNYKTGWASNQYRKRMGVWPNAYRDAPFVEPSLETRSWVKGQQIRYAKSQEKKQQTAAA